MRSRKTWWWAAVLVLGLGVAVVCFREPPGGDSSSSPHVRAAETERARARFAPLLAPHAEGSLRITGVVRDARGPVAGVQVSASRVDADTLSERPCPQQPSDHRHASPWLHHGNCCFVEMAAGFARWVEAREGEAPVVAQTLTADDGTFVLKGLSAGAFTLWALGDTGATVRPGIPAGSDAVLLLLEPGFFFSGRVVEELTRAPVPGAQVTLIHEDGSRFFDALTDAQGRFRAGPLPAGRYLKVASAKGWRTKSFDDDDVWRDADTDVTLELQRRTRLEGLVLTPEGLPASGLDVHLRPTEEGGDTSSTRTDVHGRFVFEEVSVAPQELWTQARDGTTHGEAWVTPPGNVVLRMKPSWSMEGTVRDEQHRPLAGVRLRVSSHRLGGQPPPATLTDAAGRYRLGLLLNPAINLELMREHYIDRLEPVSLGKAHEGPWDFTLTRAQQFEGRVVDTEGLPLAGAQVTLDMTHDVPERLFRSHFPEDGIAESDETGHFFVDSERKGSGRVLVTARGFRSVLLPVEVPSTGVRVVMSRGASVSGEVLDATGRPVSNAKVWLWNTAPRSGDAHRADVDAQGAFSLGGLEPGHYVVEARLRTPGIERAVSQPLDLEERTQATVSLRFQEGRTVRGMTVDSAGQPVPAVRIQACLLLEDVPAWQTDAPDCFPGGEGGILSGLDGRFVFNHLTASAYRLIAWKEGEAFAPSRSRGGTPDTTALLVTAGKEDVRLVLERRPRLRGQVVSDNGTPLPCEVRERSPWVHAPDGTFELPLPEDGPARIQVRAKGFLDLQREFVVSPGTDIDLGTLRMSRGRTVRFRVLDEATRAPLAGVSVGFDPLSDPLTPLGHALPSHYGNLDAEGGIALEGVPFERASFFISVHTNAETEKEVVLDATQETVTVLVPGPER
ncbi:carboxypeptidase regulatory-like domain-containing protein [Corallococcus exiguus]|uniref:carboxypeptidase regulatory-like domain-containing protein n=1 Tax=Corallococcus exiguus TaxID=83462 RepID=UPI003DA47B75